MPESSPSVLLIRLDAIGDALALVPLLAALRTNGVAVDVVLRAVNAGIFSGRAARRIVVADFDLRSNRAATRAAIERLGDRLAERAYSHALVATEDPGGYRLARATRAPVRVGFSNAWGKPVKALWTRRFLTQRIFRSAGLDRRAPHECEVLFALGRSLLQPEARPSRDAAVLRPLVLDREPPRDDRIAVQITDKWERLGIAFDDVVALVHRLQGFGTLRLLSAAAEGPYASRIASATATQIERFTDVVAWKAAIGAARAIVAPDSGALHVAGAIGTPVVAVFPPDPQFTLQVARWAPWAAPHRIVRAERDWPALATDALAQLL